jgi:hypothetical protein
MWRPEDGGWRARPYEIAVAGALPEASSGNNLSPLQMVVQFVAPDPSMHQSSPKAPALPIWLGSWPRVTGRVGPREMVKTGQSGTGE